MPWLNLSGRQRLPVIRQSTFADCGLACIAMIAAYYGNNVDLAGLRRRFGGPLAGAGLTNLIRTAESLHFSTRAVRCRLSELACVPQPCILHWGFDHFVVLRKAHRSHLMIHDPACGELKVPFGEADTKFTGVALELAPGRAFAKRRPSRRLKLTDLIVADSEFGRGLSSALLLAVVSELLLLATPFICKWSSTRSSCEATIAYCLRSHWGSHYSLFFSWLPAYFASSRFSSCRSQRCSASPRVYCGT